MAFSKYGVLVGHVYRHRREINDPTPHFQLGIHARGKSYRAPINVRSRLEPSELVYSYHPDFKHPLLQKLNQYPEGYTELGTGTRSGLDYIRGNYFSMESIVALPHHRRGPDNDLQDLLTHFALLAQNHEERPKIYIYGQPTIDHGRYTGMHDIHMNQGNHRSFVHDDGVYQDGGLLLHLPKQKRTAALFLAFQSQALQTDDTTGHAIIGSPRFEHVINGTYCLDCTSPYMSVRIIAAVVDPEGHDHVADLPESITLLNTRPTPMKLKGWTLVNHQEQVYDLSEFTIEPHDTLRVEFPGTEFNLANKGGSINLLDENKNKIHGVSYSKDRVIEGRTLIFEH